MEAVGLGVFMVSACVFGLVLEHPGSALRGWLPDDTVRRVLMGLAMGGTAIGIIYSPWGKQSGAHLNPAVTLTFFRLGKTGAADTLFYSIFQLAGGLAGVLLVALIAGSWLSHPKVNYVVTVPGSSGVAIAWMVEFVISFVLMTAVLWVSNSRFARWTGLCAGALVAANITLAGPLSGMSMNPARTFASAVPAQVWQAAWIYFTAPPLAMLAAAELYLRLRGASRVFCAKLHHQNPKRCIFCEQRQS
jgi:aquaporin Z